MDHLSQPTLLGKAEPNAWLEGFVSSCLTLQKSRRGKPRLFVLNTLRWTANFKPMKFAPTGLEPRPSTLEGNAQANCTTSTLCKVQKLLLYYSSIQNGKQPLLTWDKLSTDTIEFTTYAFLGKFLDSLSQLLWFKRLIFPQKSEKFKILEHSKIYRKLLTNENFVATGA